VLAIVFQVADERYALPARDVVEVLPRVSLSRMPHAPPWNAGLLAYRGTAVPVIDLNRRLLDARCPPRLGNRILVLDVDRGGSAPRERFGLLVEQVLEVRSLPERGALTSSHAGLDRHVTSLAEGQLLQMLDLEAIVGAQASAARAEGP
jgi:chemotaxis signal transduction protein